MAVAPYDPLAQVHQREMRLYAADVQARINPATPGQIPSKPATGSTATGQDRSGETGWARSERYQQMAADRFSSGGSGWQAFSGGGARAGGGSGSAQIDGGGPASFVKREIPKLDLPSNASGFARQGAAFDYAANFQEHARDWSRMLGTSRRV